MFYGTVKMPKIKFISLTNAYNNLRLALNADQIVGVFEQPDGTCTIEFLSTDANENTVSVKETYDEIRAMIYDYNNKV